MKMLAHEIDVHETSKFFQELEPLFSKPQYNHFVEFVFGLIGSDNKQVSSISHSLVKGVDQSSMNRFLNLSDWEPILVKNQIRTKIMEIHRRISKTKGIWLGYSVWDSRNNK
ncbi:MAG: hypothetical protein ACTSRG_08325 [Candidatus Helarchaeota archaeon]